MNLGKIQMNDNAGNAVITYDKERTLCDIKEKVCDISQLMMKL